MVSAVGLITKFDAQRQFAERTLRWDGINNSIRQDQHGVSNHRRKPSAAQFQKEWPRKMPARVRCKTKLEEASRPARGLRQVATGRNVRASVQPKTG